MVWRPDLLRAHLKERKKEQANQLKGGDLIQKIEFSFELWRRQLTTTAAHC